jgi:predicted  nucleic acid-binding Zn-ribbon protein
MEKSQLDRLVLYQDIHLMLKETMEEEEKIGFRMEGIEGLKKALNELEESIEVRYIRTYKRLSTRHKRPVAPVQDSTCLGCFAKLPTSYEGRGRDHKNIFTCEQCGRILYWIE